MGKIVSKVPEFVKRAGWEPIDLIRRGLSQMTAYRAARGEVDFSLAIVAKICDALGVTDLGDVFIYVPDEPEMVSDRKPEATP